MTIRKLFKFEGAHIVRNCSSDRCKKSLHGHSYIVEVFFEADKLDNGYMVYDFGLTKGTVKDIVDSFDHAYSMWNKETEDYQAFIKANSERWISMPISPSAEGYSLMFLYIIDHIMNNTEFTNGESVDIKVSAVRVHETATGYAEATQKDLYKMVKFSLKDIIFSDQVKAEWGNPQMWDELLANKKWSNPTVSVTH